MPYQDEKQDPTRVDLHYDPRVNIMVGYTNHKRLPFNVPYVSQITDNLWQGGCANGLILPDIFDHVVSLYKWEQYTIVRNDVTVRTIKMYDAEGSVDRDQVIEIAEYVNECRKTGITLSHCQAGLNRSALIAGTALILEGQDPEAVISLLREKRGPAVLCNESFERFLLEFND